MFGLLSVAAKSTALEIWGSLWAIVAGVIAAVLFLGGIVRALWDLWTRPKLVIECGNSKEFNRRLATGTPDVTKWAEGGTVKAAFVKTFRVRETKGRRAAREVSVSVIAADSPGEIYELPSPLKWLDDSETTDILPHKQKHIVLQMIVFVVRDKHWISTRTPIDGSSPQEITIEISIQGRPRVTKRFCVEDAWPGLRLQMHTPVEEVPDPFPFPSVTAAS